MQAPGSTQAVAPGCAIALGAVACNNVLKVLQVVHQGALVRLPQVSAPQKLVTCRQAGCMPPPKSGAMRQARAPPGSLCVPAAGPTVLRQAAAGASPGCHGAPVSTPRAPSWPPPPASGARCGDAPPPSAPHMQPAWTAQGAHASGVASSRSRPPGHAMLASVSGSNPPPAAAHRLGRADIQTA